MQELVTWYQSAVEDTDMHPLLAIGGFVVVCLEIHRFQDGNGRLRRVLTTLLLLRAGYAYVTYSSLESVIEQSKEAYYLALRQMQGSIHSSNPEWTPWLEFFLSALQRQMLWLKIQVERKKLMIGAMPELAAKIVESHARTGTLDHGRCGQAPRCLPEHAQAALQSACK